MRTALIVVDIQNDFCPGGALAVPYGDTVVPVANALLDMFPLSVLTQDWHSPHHCSFASTQGRPPYAIDNAVRPPALLWPDHCVAGTHGADFYPGLAVEKARIILRKGTNPHIDSYSCFFENDRTTTTGLASWLAGMGVTRVCIAGLATDYCVLYSALDALRLGFEVVLAQDGLRGVDAQQGDSERAIATMHAAGCHIIHSLELRP